MFFMPKIATRWTPDELAKLIELADRGATLMRAAAALSKSQSSVIKRAKMLGKFFPSARAVRAKLRASGAIEDLRR